jgi:hypothetical protein
MVGHAGDPETSGPMGQGGFYRLFVHCLRAEMSFRCRPALPGEKCLLDLLRSVLHKYKILSSNTYIAKKKESIHIVTKVSFSHFHNKPFFLT